MPAMPAVQAMAKENRRRGLFIFPTHPHSRGITLQAIEGKIYTVRALQMGLLTPRKTLYCTGNHF